VLLAREGQPAPGAGAGVNFGAPNGIDAFGDVIAIRMSATMNPTRASVLVSRPFRVGPRK